MNPHTRCIGILAFSLLAAGHDATAASSDPALARDLLRELVEIDTSPAFGCTKAAEAPGSYTGRYLQVTQP